jgi:HEAT repeat protein
MRAVVSLQEMHEVETYGPRAVPVLASYFDSEDYRAQHLSVRLLSAIGGKAVIGPLTKAAERSPSDVVRLSAILCLGRENWDDVSAVIERAAASDESEIVRNTAQQVLTSHERADAAKPRSD